MNKLFLNSLDWLKENKIPLPQDIDELYWLWKHIRLMGDKKVFLEIGSRDGGSFYAISSALNNNSMVISIDLPGGLWGTEKSDDNLMKVHNALINRGYDAHVILGNSQSNETMEKLLKILNGKLIDYLFIDGDHTYNGVKVDWEKFSPLVKDGGLVIFHDICPGDIKEVEVDIFWAELKKKFKYAEKIKQWGIGIIFKDLKNVFNNDSTVKKANDFFNWYNNIQKVGSYPSGGFFEGAMEFINRLPFNNIQSVLDAGMGEGEHCKYFSSRGLDVVGITDEVNEKILENADKFNYMALEMDMHFLNFDDNSFDLIWCNHSLEHTFSPLMVLREFYRVLKPNKYLAISVPPYCHHAVSQHYTIGWNVAQLVYLLGIVGFDLSGSIIYEQGYNVRALVKKREKDDIDYVGLSNMFKLREIFPEDLQKIFSPCTGGVGQYYIKADFSFGI